MRIFRLFKKKRKGPVKISLPAIIETTGKARFQEDPELVKKEKDLREAQLVSKVVKRFAEAFDRALLKHTNVIMETIEDHTNKVNNKIETEIKKVNEKIDKVETNLKEEFLKHQEERFKEIYLLLREKGFELPNKEVVKDKNHEDTEDTEDTNELVVSNKDISYEQQQEVLEEDISNEAFCDDESSLDDDFLISGLDDARLNKDVVESLEEEGLNVVVEGSEDEVLDVSDNSKEEVLLLSESIVDKNDNDKNLNRAIESQDENFSGKKLPLIYDDSRYWFAYNFALLVFLDTLLKNKLGDLQVEYEDVDIQDISIFLDVDTSLYFKLVERIFNEKFSISDVNSSYLDGYYKFSVSVYKKLILFVVYTLKQEISNSDLTSKDLKEIFYLLDLIIFLLKKSVFLEENFKYFSSDFKYKEGLHVDIEKRYMYYSRTFLSSHNALVLFFILSYYYSNSNKKNFNNVKELLLLIAGALFHDIGKIYSSKVSQHKDEIVLELFIKDYSSKFSFEESIIFLEKMGLSSFVEKIKIQDNSKSNGIKRRGPRSNIDTISDLSDISNFFSSTVFEFIKLVFKYHSTLNVKESLSDEQFFNFKILFFSDKYARLFENRVIEFFNLKYNSVEIFSESFDNFKSIILMNNYFTYIPEDFKKAYYSNLGFSGVNYSSYSSITKELTDKGKKLFLEDFKKLVEFFVYIEENRNIKEHDFYNVSFSSSRKLYKVPMKSLGVELLSRGWLNLFSYFFANIFANEEINYKDILHSRDISFLYKKLGFNIFDMSDNFFVENDDGDFYLCMSKDFVERVLSFK